MFSAYSDRSASCHTTGATVTAPEPAEEATMSIETSIGLETGQPYPYRRTELVEPTIPVPDLQAAMADAALHGELESAMEIHE